MAMRLRSKTLLFRSVAIGLGIGVVLLVEGLLRLLGWGAPDPMSDPFVSFRGARSLFVRNENGTEFETATVRTNYFVRDRFSVNKSDDTFRAFFLGGSTVQGRPYAIETAFPRWLELALEAQDPKRKWEMVNCGGISYASYRLVPILDECLASYSPDLIVLCTGQNEFLEDRTYGEIRDTPDVLAWLRARLHSSHLLGIMEKIGRQLRGLATGGDEPLSGGLRPILPEEVDAFLDYQNGLEAYRWDPEWRRGVEKHFERNVERMIQMCRLAGVPVVILSPPVNLRSNPPFKSEHRSDLSPSELDQWQQWMGEAQRLSGSAPLEAIRYLEKAVELDPQFAETHFALGTLLEGMGRSAEAREWFVSAKERDVCPLRLLESQRESLSRIARHYAVPFVDLHDLLEGQSEFVSLGSELLLDHVHPSIRGHQLTARELQRRLVGEAYLPEDIEPETSAINGVFQGHLDSLSPVYFVQGKMRLDNLMLWTQGRTDGLPLDLKPRPETE